METTQGQGPLSGISVVCPSRTSFGKEGTFVSVFCRELVPLCPKVPGVPDPRCQRPVVRCRGSDPEITQIGGVLGEDGPQETEDYLLTL